MGEDVCMNLTGEKIHEALCASLKMVILSFPASFFWTITLLNLLWI